MSANPAPATDRSTVMRTLVATGAGNAAEWFDWAIYATFASFIASQLFSHADPASAFLATLAVFAVGFAARPLGGFFFGWLGDQLGRKTSLVWCVMLASLGSLVIAFCPTYDAVGAWSSVILLVARIVQGLAHGGELPSAQTYLSEMAPRERRGLWSSLIYFSGTLGIMAGTFIGAILSTILSEAQMSSFGWRIPFLIGAVIGLFALYMRTKLEETEAFEEASVEGGRRPEAPAGSAPENVFRQLATNWRQAAKVIGLTVGLTVVYYVWGVSTPAYAIHELGIDATGALWAGVAANVVFLVALPLWGRLSDRIGRKPVLLVSGVGSAVFFFPATLIVRDSAVQLALGMSIMLVFIAASAAIVPSVYAELFPTTIRTMGVAIPYAICVAAFGGTAAYLQAGMNAWFGAAGPTIFGIYTVVLLCIGIGTVFTLRETKGIDLRQPSLPQEKSTTTVR
ncbi:MFS transporter [Arthrobacter sp. JSM 101049]|uniref:MFS transporter n=1 Tax=Arthrobacter sp. JSM 101049 TaxID=929097 RepID=UPI0035683409